MAADDGRVDEAQLDALGQRAGHLAPGQRVHLELQAAGDAAVGVLLARDLAGLVVDDHGAEQVFVHAVVAPAHAIGPEREAELLLDVGRLDAVGLLLVPEPSERVAAGRLAGLLVLARQESLGRLPADAGPVVQDVLARPRPLVDGEQIVERRVVADGATGQVVLDNLVDDGAVGHGVMATDRDALDVDVEVLERTGLVIVDLLVAERDLRVRRQRDQQRLHGFRRGGEVLDLLDGARLERPRRIARKIERFQHELADLALAGASVIARAREIELAPRPGHADVEEPAFFLLVIVPGRQHGLHHVDRQVERVAPAP